MRTHICTSHPHRAHASGRLSPPAPISPPRGRSRPWHRPLVPLSELAIVAAAALAMSALGVAVMAALSRWMR